MKTYHNSVCGNHQTTTGLLALFLLLISTLIPSVVDAATANGGYHMILNGRSLHLTKAPEGETYNENNIGTGVQYEFDRRIGSRWVSYATGSAFNDSFNNLSYYVGGGKARRYRLRNGWHLDAGYVAFVMARRMLMSINPSWEFCR